MADLRDAALRVIDDILSQNKNLTLQMLLKLANQGASIILISQDIDELLSVTDRICAICHGRLSRTFSTEEMTPEHLGALMLGQEIDS